MKGVFVLLFAVISMSCAEPLGNIPGLDVVTGLLPGGVLSNGKGAANALANAKGITSLTKDGVLLNLGGLLGLNDDTDCIRLCPQPIGDTSMTCVPTTAFDKYPVCYGKNTLNKWLYPCVKKKGGKGKPKTKKGK